MLVAIVLAVVITAVVYLIAYPLLTLWDTARGNVNGLQTLFMGTVAPGLGGAAGYYAAVRLIKLFDQKVLAIGYSVVVLASAAIVGYAALTVAAPGQYGAFDFFALGLSHLAAIAGLLVAQRHVGPADG
jgi:hypothetical protein